MRPPTFSSSSSFLLFAFACAAAITSASVIRERTSTACPSDTFFITKHIKINTSKIEQLATDCSKLADTAHHGAPSTYVLFAAHSPVVYWQKILTTGLCTGYLLQSGSANTVKTTTAGFWLENLSNCDLQGKGAVVERTGEVNVKFMLLPTSANVTEIINDLVDAEYIGWSV